MEIYEKTDNVARWKWALQQYVSPFGRKAIDDFRKGMAQGPFKTDMDVFLKMLAKMDKWESSHIKALKGEAAGLTEIMWASGKIEHRIVGYRIADATDGKHRYVMLIGCTHKQRNYIPPSALKTAQDRASEIQKGVATISEYSLVTGR